MTWTTPKLNSDSCLYCEHPRSAHDAFDASCMGGDGVCDCVEFAEEEDDDAS